MNAAGEVVTYPLKSPHCGAALLAINLATGRAHRIGQPQMIEVTKNKQVVWIFKDFINFGNSTPVGIVLD